MRLIGRGWQNEIYDLGNGRVRKLKYPNFLRYLVILFHLKDFSFTRAYSELKRIDEVETRSNSYLRSIAALLNPEILGNPVFIGEENYEQDKVKMLGTELKNRSMEEGKRLIDKYINLIYTTWEYGFADSVFNFTINNGVNPAERMMQVDFGELVTEKADVIRDIETKRWLQSSSFLCFLRQDLKNYYRESMGQKLTLSELDKRWATRLV